MAEEKSTTFEDTFIYSAHADDGERPPRAVTVAFFATSLPEPEQLGDALKEHFTAVPMSEEVWLVTAESNESDLRGLSADDKLTDRLARSSALAAVRLVLFDGRGAWRDITGPVTDDDFVVAAAQDGVQTAGLRRLFKDTGALVDAHAGLHYVKPGGKHTRRFIRAAATTARSAHAHFVAAAMLGWASAQRFDRIWVDTASITGVGYALGYLLNLLNGTPVPRVDTFGGHENLPTVSFTTPSIALISASTSGTLSDSLAAQDLAQTKQRTLFYVGEEEDPTVLCDMTDRAKEDDPDLVSVWDSHPADKCPDCENQQNAILLKGDSFTPAPGLATPITLATKYSDPDHQAFAKHFFRTGVISLNRSDEASRAVTRPVSLHLEQYVSTEEGLGEVRNALSDFIPFRTRYIVHPDNPDAVAIAKIALDLCHGVGRKDVELVPARSLRGRGKMNEGLSLVIAGVVSRGHDLLNISRELRKLIVDGGDIAYFIGILRPPGKKMWATARSSLTFRVGSGARRNYDLTSIWYVETEPADDENRPWDDEREVLDALRTWMRRSSSGEPADAVIAERIRALGAPLEGRTAFLNSDHGAPAASMDMQLNPNFAFWDRSIGRAAPDATHAEVYFTISTVLHRARHTFDGKYSLFEQPGFGNVLAAENFDRFNDAVIQSAILRAARGRELRFEELDDESRHMANILIASLSDWEDVERGGAALEFVFALIRGYEGRSGALRLKKVDAERVLACVTGVSKVTAPLLEVALRYLAMQVAAAKI